MDIDYWLMVIIRLFNSAVSNVEYDGNVIVNCEWVWIWKEAVLLTLSKVISQHSRGGSEEIDGALHLEQAVAETTCANGISQVHI
jgi:hypothetical protein